MHDTSLVHTDKSFKSAPVSTSSSMAPFKYGLGCSVHYYAHSTALLSFLLSLFFSLFIDHFNTFFCSVSFFVTLISHFGSLS